MIETLAGDPQRGFLGQILSDILHLPAWIALGVPGVLMLIASFLRKE
jgi:hypothetical protein